MGFRFDVGPTGSRPAAARLRSPPRHGKAPRCCHPRIPPRRGPPAAPRRASPSCRWAARRRWSTVSASSRGCAPRATRSPRSTRAPTPWWSTPAASSTAPRPSRWPPSATPWRRTARSSSRAAWGPSPTPSASATPNVLAVSGPQAYESVMAAVHEAAEPLHDPFFDLLPPQGIKLTPRHYSYLKIAEGCNNSCSFCIIPRLRGRLVSRPVSDVAARGREAREGGREGAARRVAGHGGLWARPRLPAAAARRPGGAGEVPRPRPRVGLARRLDAAPLHLPLPACRRSRAADGRGDRAALPRHPVSSTRRPTCCAP